MTALTILSSDDFKISKESIEGELEVEQLLHDIGIFSDDAVVPSPEVENPLKDATFYLPEYENAIVSDESDGESSSRSTTTTTEETMPAPQATSSEFVVATPAAIEKMENFSVPNPFAVSVPNPILPSSPVAAVKVEPAVVQIYNKPVQRQQQQQSPPPKIAASGIKTETVSNYHHHQNALSTASNLTSRKRKADAPVAVPSYVHPPLDKELTEEQMEERRVRNREHAKRSRLRKKSLTQTLQQSADEVKAENRKMIQILQERIGKDKADAIISERRSRALKFFLSSLQKPENRVLDDQTASFLKSLKKKLPKSTNKKN